MLAKLTCVVDLFQPNTVVKLLTVVPDGAVKNLMAAYLYNCSSTLRQYAKYNERHLSPLKVLIIKLMLFLPALREQNIVKNERLEAVIYRQYGEYQIEVCFLLKFHLH